MIRTFLKPDTQNISIRLPQSFVGKKIEVIAFVVDETNDNQIVKDPIQTYFASEKVLSKDWLTPEEENAWRDL
jgi:hypothetical protein